MFIFLIFVSETLKVSKSLLHIATCSFQLLVKSERKVSSSYKEEKTSKQKQESKSCENMRLVAYTIAMINNINLIPP